MRQSGFNGTRQVIDILANGTLTPILATGPVVYVEVKESQVTSAGAVNVPQGFEYKLPNDKFTQVFVTIPGEELTIGDRKGHYKGAGTVLGNGPDAPGAGVPPRTATELFAAQALTAAPTSIEVTQYFS